MKTHLTIAAILTASLGITNLAVAHGGGGGGGHFGGGGGMHFGGGGTHFSAPAFGGHFGGHENHGSGFERGGRGRLDHFGHRGGFFGGGYGPYYYGDGGYGDPDYSTFNDSSSFDDSTVLAVQEALARQGYYRGALDGDLDLFTEDAIAAYERAHRLPVTRTINQALLDSLRL